MSARKHTLDGYALVPANEAQDLIATQREWVEWGHPLLTQHQFITREKDVLGTSDFSVTRRRRWVLVPADDTHTLDFLAGCETYRRPILVRRGGGEVQRALAYSVCSVFVPEDKRRHGYAAKMMTLLQHHLNPAGCVPPPLDQGSIQDSGSVVAPLDDPSLELSDDGAYGGNATCSFLYSDIGEYYSKFAWTVVGNRHVQWKPSTSSADLPADARWLTADELNTIGRIDRSHLLSTLQTSSSPALRFCLDDPEATSWRWLIRRTNFYATTLLPSSAPKPSYFGLLLPGSSQTDASYAVWMFDFIERKVAILRLRFTSASTFKMLVGAVRAQAAEFGMQKCLAWNVDLASLGVELSQEDEQRLKQGEAVHRHQHALAQGELVERHGKSASLPALAWYADRAEGEQVEWVCNEYGWWC